MYERTRNVYSAREKLRAVDGCLELGIARYHRKTGIPIATLNVWLKQSRAGVELTRTRGGRKSKKAVGVEFTRVFIGSEKVKKRRLIKRRLIK
jgi:transposase-like protein